MSQQAALLSETKKDVRAFLISDPKGRSIDEIKRDFRDILGKPLPYRKLGYVNEEEMFRDMPDVCSLMWERGILILKGIADETTRHIQKLVLNQKRKPRSRRPFRAHFRPPPPKPMVSYQMQQNIRELLMSYPNGLQLSSFGVAFQRRFSSMLDYSIYGFRSVSDLLHSIPDISFEENTGGARLYLRQMQTTRNKINPLMDQEWNYGSGNKQEQQQQYTQFIPPRLQRQNAHTTENKQPLSQSSTSQSRKSPRSSGQVSLDLQETSGINPSIKLKILKVLDGKEKGIWAARFPFEYKKLYKTDLPFRELGFLSVIDFMGALSDIVTIERPGQAGDWMIYDKQVYKEVTANKMEEVQAVRPSRPPSPGISVRLKEMVRQVLQQRPHTVIADFPDVFKVLTGQNLPMEDLGYRTLESMLLDLLDVIKMNYTEGSGSVTLTALPIEGDPRSDLLKLPSNGALQAEASQADIPKRHLPADAVGPNVHYSPLPLPKASADRYIEVLVSNISSPGHFWFQLKGKNTTEALETVMDKLEDFYYSLNSEGYELPESMITVGQVCATVFPEDDNWHRVQITGKGGLDFVEVYFVDYGNTCSVHKSNLRLLRRSLLQLPAQAVLARLSNIQPIKGTLWEVTARNRMLSMVANKPLVALATGIKNNVVSLCLVDTSTNDDIHINDVLVQEGHARFVPDDIPPDQLEHMMQPRLNEDLDLPLGAEASSQSATLEAHSMTEDNLEAHNRSTEEATMGQAQSTGSLVPRYVKEVQLTEEDDIAHIVNYGGKPYLLEGEITAYLWESDSLRSLLRKKKLEVPNTVVFRNSNPELFQELMHYEVPGLVEGDSVRSHVTLYPMEVIPTILEAFNHPSMTLRQAILQNVNDFDPEEPYWKGEEVFDTTSEEADFELDLEGLHLTLRSLQFKRERIIREMMSGNSKTDVNELNHVEHEMTSIRKRIKAHEENDHPNNQKHKPTEQEELIQRVMETQISSPPRPTKTAAVTPSVQYSDEADSIPASPHSSIKTNIVAPMQASTVQDTKEAQDPVGQDSGLGAQASTGGLPGLNLLTGGVASNAAQQQLLLQQMLLNQQLLNQQNQTLLQGSTAAGLTGQLTPSVIQAATNPGLLNAQLLQNQQLLGQAAGQQPLLSAQALVPTMTQDQMIKQNQMLLNCLLTQNMGGIGLGRGQPLGGAGVLPGVGNRPPGLPRPQLVGQGRGVATIPRLNKPSDPR
ncbi:unnamed protein product [Owenia fusiformis]|uniref:Uncharacterized protein n=1 Tax=Owenia fusiformis TaxID=6347 RepID=A0A8J1TZM4_OWEFU|nr:unnamed protein product [Owenia fusiformis]